MNARASTLKLITYTSLYPNSEMPQHGLFVEQRLRRIVATGRAQATVIAPVPWFPSASPRFGEYGRMARVPRFERRSEIDVLHPRYPTIPKFGMNVQARLLAMATQSVVESVRRAWGGAVIDAHYFYPDGVAAVAIGQALSVPVTITARGSDVNTLAEFPGPRASIVEAARRCAAVVTVSEALRSRLIALGVPGDRISVLRNGVDLDFFSPGSFSKERDALGLKGHVMMSVGRLVHGKGHDLAIRALSELRDSLLVIAGAGPEADALKSLAAQRGVQDRVRFIGSVPPESLRRYYRAADVLILASAAEGMPNVVLEALACGTPVVASHVGGIPEVMNNSVGRVLSERSAAAIAAAVDDLRQSHPGRESVREWATQFDWRDTIEKSVQLYQRVTSQ